MKKILVCALFRGQICQSHDLPFEGSSCSRQCVARKKASFAIYWAFFPALRLANDDFPETAVRAQRCLAEAINKGPLRSASSRACDVTWHDMTSRPCDQGTSFLFPYSTATHSDPGIADWPPLCAQVLWHLSAPASKAPISEQPGRAAGNPGNPQHLLTLPRGQSQGKASKFLLARTIVLMLSLPTFSILKAFYSKIPYIWPRDFWSVHLTEKYVRISVLR